MFHARQRTLTGQSVLALTMLIAFSIVGAIGLFGYEVNRVSLARDQLRAACDAAALAAAAALASSDNVDPVDAHAQAMDMALSTFQQNSVLGVSLASASFSTSAEDKPSLGMSSILIEFLDPHNEQQPVPIGDPAGKIVRVTAAMNVEPAFGRFLGINEVPVRVISSGGVPNLDVVLCFDVSGSIDDQTPVTFVRRQWNAAIGRIDYIVPPTSGAAPAGPLAQGRLYDIIGPPATGSAVQAVYPQRLSNSNSGSTNRWPLNFSERPSAPGSARGLRGSANTGTPPGNCPPGTSGVGNQYTYTDLVVNIDGRTSFQGITVDGYRFPNVATLVEAARGNLENATVFETSRAREALEPFGITPLAGYQDKYFQLAHEQCQPIATARMAARDFFTIMNTNTDGHFGFIAFSDNGGSSPTGTWSQANIDSNYASAGNGAFPMPGVAISSAEGATNYDAIVERLPSLVATAGTNIGDAVNDAVNMLISGSRAGSKKAIVLFTDGMPTVGGPLHSNPLTNARRAAVNARNAGIPIYTIGLAQNPEIVPYETAILNDTNPSPTEGGMAAIAGGGGKFFLVTDVNNLRYTFENIARHLVQLVK